MHARLSCMYRSIACLMYMPVQYQARSIELATYPAPEQGSGTVFSLESAHDLGVGGRQLAMSL